MVTKPDCQNASDVMSTPTLARMLSGDWDPPVARRSRYWGTKPEPSVWYNQANLSSSQPPQPYCMDLIGVQTNSTTLLRYPAQKRSQSFKNMTSKQWRGILKAAPRLAEPNEETHQISLLRVSEPNGKANVVELDDFLQPSRRAIVEVGRSRCQSPQDRSFKLADVRPLARD